MNAPKWLEPFLEQSDAVIITDEQHTILEVNTAYEKITGCRRDEVTGRRAGFLKSGLTPEETYQSMKDTLRAGRSWSGVFTNRKNNQDLWHSSITITPFQLEGKLYYVGVFRELEKLSRGHYLTEDRLDAIQRSLLRVLAISCEIRDPAIEEHLLRVQQGTGELLQAHIEHTGSPLSASEAHQIIHASILHDIGKSCVPEGILYKPGALNRYEWNIIRMHPLMGADLLDKMDADFTDGLLAEHFAVARNIVLYHHERWDGGGYPHGLAGRQIPLEARLVSLVDVYDALVSKRPYKESWSPRQAIEYIREQRGKQFDPELADQFIQLKSSEA